MKIEEPKMRPHRRFFKVPAAKRILFFQNLGLMLGSGVDVLTCLDTLSNETPDNLVTVSARRRTMPKKLGADQVAELFHEGPSPEKRRLATSLAGKDLESLSAQLGVHIFEGHRLSHAMSKYPEVFSEQQIALVAVGEESGSLPRILKEIAESELKNYRRFLNLRKELYAPFFTLIVSLVFFLVIPGLLFDSLVESEMMSSGIGYHIVKASAFLTSPPALAMLGGVLLIAFIVLASRSRRSFILSRGLWIARVVGPVNTIYKLRRSLIFSQSFKLLLTAGAPLIRSLELALDSCADEEFKRVKPYVIEDIKSGQKIAESLRRDNVEILPDSALSLLAVGEESGKMPRLIESSMTLMEDELEHAVHALTMLISPVVMAFVAVVVLVLGISVFQSVSSFAL